MEHICQVYIEARYVYNHNNEKSVIHKKVTRDDAAAVATPQQKKCRKMLKKDEMFSILFHTVHVLPKTHAGCVIAQLLILEYPYMQVVTTYVTLRNKEPTGPNPDAD